MYFRAIFFFFCLIITVRARNRIVGVLKLAPITSISVHPSIIARRR